MGLTKEKTMMVAAHRGDSYNYDENTMEAFEMAIREGADMIETDVRLTKDFVPVLLHDDTAARTAYSDRKICDMTYDEVLALNAGSRAHPLRAPTLEQLLQRLSKTRVLLNLEVKEYLSDTNRARCEQCVELCVGLIERYDMAGRMVFNSFDAYVLEYIAKRYPGRYLLHGFYPYDIMKHVSRSPDEYLYCACLFSDRNPAHYRYLLARGIEPWIGAGVTKEAHLKECFELGARLVTTNFPTDCMEKLKRAGIR